MSGLEPMKMQEGGSPEFLSREGFLSLRDDPERLNVRDITDFIFDPTDPLDIAAGGAAATGLGIPAALGMKGLSTAKKVTKGLGALAGMIPGTMAAREVIDVSSDPVEYTRGIIDLVASVPDAGGAMGDIAKALREDPEGTSAIIYETIRESSGYPMQKRDGGIMQYAEGGDIGMLPPNARTPGGKKKKAVMTVSDLIEDVAEKLPTKATPKTKPKAAKKRLEEARKAESDAARASTQKSQEAIDKANEVKKAEGIKEGAAAQAAKPSMIKKAVKPTLIGAGIVGGASLLPGGDKSDAERPQEPTIRQDSTDDITKTFDIDNIATSDKWANIMKYNLVQNQGFQVDDQGNFVEKPKFLDYLKALPSSYMDKVSRDTDFAKKMMAGFLNMMKPVEGYVPVNPVVAFGEGYLGEETRQAEMLPADARLLEYLKANPEQYARMLSLEKTRASAIGEYKIEEAQKQAEEIKKSLIQQSSKYTGDDYNDLNVYYKDPNTGKPVGPIDGTRLMSLQDKGLGFFEYGFYLEPK